MPTTSTPIPSSNPTSGQSGGVKSLTGAIAGGVVGLLACTVIIAAIFFCWRRRKRLSTSNNYSAWPNPFVVIRNANGSSGRKLQQTTSHRPNGNRKVKQRHVRRENGNLTGTAPDQPAVNVQMPSQRLRNTSLSITALLRTIAERMNQREMSESLGPPPPYSDLDHVQ
jgi:hypothetical protein